MSLLVMLLAITPHNLYCPVLCLFAVTSHHLPFTIWTTILKSTVQCSVCELCICGQCSVCVWECDHVCKADHNVFKLDGGGRSSEWGVSEGTVR